MNHQTICQTLENVLSQGPQSTEQLPPGLRAHAQHCASCKHHLSTSQQLTGLLQHTYAQLTPTLSPEQLVLRTLQLASQRQSPQRYPTWNLSLVWVAMFIGVGCFGLGFATHRMWSSDPSPNSIHPLQPSPSTPTTPAYVLPPSGKMEAFTPPLTISKKAKAPKRLSKRSTRSASLRKTFRATNASKPQTRRASKRLYRRSPAARIAAKARTKPNHSTPPPPPPLPHDPTTLVSIRGNALSENDPLPPPPPPAPKDAGASRVAERFPPLPPPAGDAGTPQTTEKLPPPPPPPPLPPGAKPDPLLEGLLPAAKKPKKSAQKTS